MSDLLAHARESIEARKLFEQGQGILIAVSGGLDSMVLLHIIHKLSSTHGWRLVVGHLNHQLRGRSSDADERLVRRTGERLGVPVVVERTDVRSCARAYRVSLEMAARRVRHDFLARTAAQEKIPTIALAHHADDQLELFFLRLLRGSGGEGLGGMKWRNPSPRSHKIELVRPLLDQPKAALEEFATGEKIRFREDATNALLDIQRNRIRHDLLPLLRRTYQPALDRTILRAMDIIGAEAEFVNGEASDWLGRKRRRPFQQLQLAVQRRCLRLQLLKLGIAADFDLVESLRTGPDRSVTVSRAKTGDQAERRSSPQPGASAERRPRAGAPPQGLVSLSVARDSFGIVRLTLPKAPEFVTGVLEVFMNGRAREAVFAGVRIRWQIDAKQPSVRPRSKSGTEFFDADQVGARIVLRHWRPGDRFQPIGLAFSVKLQDLFTNQKVAKGRRHQLIVAVTASGDVFWVEGMRISERFKLTTGSIRRLQWCWQRV